MLDDYRARRFENTDGDKAMGFLTQARDALPAVIICASVQ
jgi:hypothetical protein